MKKAEEYLDEFFVRANLTTLREEAYKYMIKKIQLDAIEYAVNKCAENADVRMAQYEGEYIVDQKSILSTIDQIKEEMK